VTYVLVVTEARRYWVGLADLPDGGWVAPLGTIPPGWYIRSLAFGNRELEAYLLARILEEGASIAEAEVAAGEARSRAELELAVRAKMTSALLAARRA
jgi:hypothetical protein